MKTNHKMGEDIFKKITKKILYLYHIKYLNQGNKEKDNLIAIGQNI